MILEVLKDTHGDIAEFTAFSDYLKAKRIKEGDLFSLWIEYNIIRNNNKNLALQQIPIHQLKRERLCWPTREAAQASADKINEMIGGPLREGFHIMRVYEENGDWYISRYLEDV